MKSLALIPAILLLSGCALFTKVETKYIDRDIYIVRQAPSELYSVPADVEPINVDTATQRDVAGWVARKEKRSEEMQKKIDALKAFYERPVQEDEKKKSDTK